MELGGEGGLVVLNMILGNRRIGLFSWKEGVDIGDGTSRDWVGACKLTVDTRGYQPMARTI